MANEDNAIAVWLQVHHILSKQKSVELATKLHDELIDSLGSLKLFMTGGSDGIAVTVLNNLGIPTAVQRNIVSLLEYVDNEGNSITVKSVDELSVMDVSILVQKIFPEEGAYSASFHANRINGFVLKCVDSASKLVEYGIQSPIHAENFLKSLSLWKTRGVPKKYFSSASCVDADHHQRLECVIETQHTGNAKVGQHSENAKVDQHTGNAKGGQHSENAKVGQHSEYAKVDQHSENAKVDQNTGNAKVDQHSENAKGDQHSENAKVDQHSENAKVDQHTENADEAEGANAAVVRREVGINSAVQVAGAATTTTTDAPSTAATDAPSAAATDASWRPSNSHRHKFIGVSTINVLDKVVHEVSITVAQVKVYIGIFNRLQDAVRAHDRALIRAIGPACCNESMLNFSLVRYKNDPETMFSVYDDQLNEALLTKSDWTGPKPLHHELFTFGAPLIVATANEKKRTNAVTIDGGAKKRATAAHTKNAQVDQHTENADEDQDVNATVVQREVGVDSAVQGASRDKRAAVIAMVARAVGRAAANEKKRAHATSIDADAKKRATVVVEPEQLVPSMEDPEEIVPSSSSKKGSLVDTTSLLPPTQVVLPVEHVITQPLQEQSSSVTKEAEEDSSRTRSLSVSSDFSSPVKIPRKTAEARKAFQRFKPSQRSMMNRKVVMNPKTAVDSTPASIDQPSMDPPVIRILMRGAALNNSTQSNNDDEEVEANPLQRATASDFTFPPVSDVSVPVADAAVVSPVTDDDAVAVGEHAAAAAAATIYGGGFPLSMEEDSDSDSDASYAIPLRGFELNSSHKLPTTTGSTPSSSSTSSFASTPTPSSTSSSASTSEHSSSSSSSSAAELFFKASEESVMIEALADFNRTAEAGACRARYVLYVCR